jgi:hypothetical protein
MSHIDSLSDADFLRFVADVGQTIRCEEVLPLRVVQNRLRTIADRMDPDGADLEVGAALT